MSETKLTPNKSLGQHWLFDKEVLDDIAETAEVSTGDNILEVGPGLGTLTEVLLNHGANVTAVEFDKKLFDDLSSETSQFSTDDKSHLTLVNQDILKFDLTSLPADYKVVANIPYYLTAKLLRLLTESVNSPKLSVLLVQKEVAERIVAGPGQMSILAVSVQYYCEVSLASIVPAKLFTPPPKVDSQVVKLARRSANLFPNVQTDDFFRVVKAGFSERRKKLRSSLSGGLQLDKSKVDELLTQANLSPDARAQELALEDWAKLSRILSQS